ncbi:MAG: energy-coupled thiamine transporter ThiT [Clostridiales bacterium]|jgi:thiamine transporter|nr:energy-coupled thiamine transporter ThiT [Clostridiales bacterium]
MSLKRNSVKVLTYSAVLIALATVLSNVKLFDMPQGGTITAFSMVFVSLIGYFFGLRAGVVAAVAYGLLQVALDPFVIHPIQFLLDYPLAFGALGLSGLFYKQKYGLVLGYIAGVLGRLFCSTLSGIVFFPEYAEGGNVLIYSLIYNLSYMGPEAAITLLVLAIPPVKGAIDQVRAIATGAQSAKAQAQDGENPQQGEADN